MRTVLCILTVFLLVAVTAAQQSNKSVLTCMVRPTPPRDMDTPVEPRSAIESLRLGLAPHGAKRPAKHRLQVGWSGDTKLFNDKPPYNEPLDGVWWAYCGYSPTLKLHLIIEVGR